MSILSLYDLSGIQPYTFGARRLRANLGASWLVHQVLAKDGWLRDAAVSAGAEVLWSGGGNAAVSSPTTEAACDVATALSLRIYGEAPGLRLVCAHGPWSGAPSEYADAAEALRQELDRAKASKFDAAFDSGGVCEPCRDTAEPAVTFDKERVPIGFSLERRIAAFENAQERLQDIYKLEATGLTWSDDIDDLGRSFGEESALGVIHVDGNQMGKRFGVAAAQGLQAVQQLSKAVHDAGEKTLQAGLRWVHERIDKDELDFELEPTSDGQRVFPVRPVVFGGDDLTLVCDGRIAIDLAAQMLRHWHRLSEFHACAGIALVRPHFPFYRAVDIANELCRSAKDWRKQNLAEQGDASVLHWSLRRSGGPNAPTQAKHGKHPGVYVVEGVAPADRPWRSWTWFRNTCVSWLQEREDQHTQLKSLAASLTLGPDAGQRVLSRLWDRHRLRLPAPPHTTLDQNGYAQGECPYLDAIELFDLLPRGLSS